MISLLVSRARRFGPGLLVGLALLWIVPAHADSHEDKLALCTGCHGADGMPGDPSIPIIAGQEFYYLYVQLRDYQAGRRENPVMSGIVAQLGDKEQLKALAQHFAEQKWPSNQVTADDATVTKARQAITAGQCVQCHLGGFEGNSRVPRLAGQQVQYLEQTMLDFKNKVRRNSPAKSSLMKDFADDEIAALARYLGSL